MPRHQLPVIQPFVIPALGWELVDKRNLGRGPEAKRSHTLWLNEVQGTLRRNNALRDVKVCGADNEKLDRAIDRFHVEQAKQPDLEWKTFIADGGEVEEEFDCDPRLPDVFLCVRNAENRWIGGVSISNIRVERDGPGPLKASGFFLIGVPAGTPADRAEDVRYRTWHRIFRYVLNNALILETGRRLNFVQYDFLSSDTMRETMNENPNVKEFMDLMGADFVLRGDVTNRTEHLRYRSRTADEV